MPIDEKREEPLDPAAGDEREEEPEGQVEEESDQSFPASDPPSW